MEGINYVVKAAKTVDDAVREAITALDVSRDEVDIEIIDEGSKGFLSIGSRPAKVKATVKFNPVRIAVKFLKEIAGSMGVAVEVEAELKEKALEINLKGEEMGIFIGKRGQTLDSLQYLVNLAINKGDNPYISVTLDTENYRKRRKETLEALAHNLAKKVKQTKKSVVLEPMSPYERRIIHASLQNDRYISTYSEGEDPYRNVVIAFKKDFQKENGKDYNKDGAKKPFQRKSKPSYHKIADKGFDA